jgi:hypothetical protein
MVAAARWLDATRCSCFSRCLLLQDMSIQQHSRKQLGDTLIPEILQSIQHRCRSARCFRRCLLLQDIVKG